MNSLFSAWVSNPRHSLFEGAKSNACKCDEVIVAERNSMKAIAPKNPLALGSLKITPKAAGFFTAWLNSPDTDTYWLMQDIIAVWKKKGITDYMIYTKSSDANSELSWEIVPYSKSSWKYGQQFKVLWNTIFGGATSAKVERQKVAQDFAKARCSFSKSHVKKIESAKEVAQKKDAFCNPNVINNQLVFKGKEITVLLNYAPIATGPDKLHFLIVPKKHYKTFSDLPKAVYLEIIKASNKLADFYNKKGYSTLYAFNKSGKIAGQTEPHFHQHIVLPATKSEELLAKLTVFKNMLFGSSPLSARELQTRVQALKSELQDVLSPSLLNGVRQKISALAKLFF